jgi:hypothetical protein
MLIIEMSGGVASVGKVSRKRIAKMRGGGIVVLGGDAVRAGEMGFKGCGEREGGFSGVGRWLGEGAGSEEGAAERGIPAGRFAVVVAVAAGWMPEKEEKKLCWCSEREFMSLSFISMAMRLVGLMV